MKQNASSRWIVAFEMVSLATLLAFASVGCKPKAKGKSEEAAAVDGGRDAGPSGPCGKYVAKLCQEAGDASSTCRSAKEIGELLPPAACKLALKNVSYATKKLAAKRKKCDELVSKLCNDLGKETDTCKMVATQTKKFPPERCEMMLKRYDAVLKDLKRREAANKPLDAAKQKAIAAAGAPAFGPEDAKVTIVEFSDFECPYCSRAANTGHQLREKYGQKVRFVFRQFPLSFHKTSKKASEASLAAHAQGKFWEFHDLLFKNQKKHDAASLEGYAKKVGLDVATFKKALAENKYSAAVDADMKLGKEVNVQGTPTMFLNGKRVKNPTDLAGLSKDIDRLLGS
jgi:protein-disulfide isomerase